MDTFPNPLKPNSLIGKFLAFSVLHHIISRRNDFARNDTSTSACCSYFGMLKNGLSVFLSEVSFCSRYKTWFLYALSPLENSCFFGSTFIAV